MIKFVKIVCVGFCFGIFNLRSETYNVITVSRDTTAASYNRLAEEEIYLVYAQLARCIIPGVDASKLAPEGGWSEQAKDILGKPVARIENPAIPTIVVFNEAFFGQDKPLSKEEVDKITNIYKELPNTYLYMNFLYVDEGKSEYVGQIKNSTKRYEEITKEFKFPSFCFNKIQNYIMDSIAGPTAEQILLFNQTKILYKGEEVGYYNKSSFCDEYDKFLDEKLYYVIGNFNTIYWGRPPLQIDCLTCYDIDVISNGCYRHYMEEKSIFAFSSNSSSSLPCALFGIYGNLASKKILFICSDSYEDEVTAPIDCKGQDESCLKCLRGVFEYEGSILSPIEKIAEIPFEYVKAKEPIVKEEEEDEETAESKDMFSLKKFNLTIK